MAATQNAPTREQGTANTQGAWPGLLGGILRVLEQETNRDLAWPYSVRTTYPAMLNDAQIHGLYTGATLPIRAWDWRIDPNGAPPEMVAALTADLNMDVLDTDPQPRRMSSGRFDFQEHLENALRGILYGHYAFEQVAEIRQDGPVLNGGKFAHLRKLAERPPRSIWDIFVGPDGGLDSIRVPALDPSKIQDQKDSTWGWMGSARLYADQICMYVWDREGANWKGRSMLRPCYRPWKIKDRILAVGAINIERAGGVPYIEAPPGADQQTMDSLHTIASAFRVGASAGAALPHGAQLKFAAAAGGDQAVNYVKLQNEEMARSWLMMFMQLGQTSSGSRALGATFVDYFRLAQEAIAKWFAGVFNKHVIEDWVRWNYTGVEYAPLLVFKPIGAPTDELGAQIQGAQSAGALPEGSGVAALAAALEGRPGGRPTQHPFRRGVGVNADQAPVTAPNILQPAPPPLSREPLPHEQVVDWAAMQTALIAARQALVQHWQDVRARQTTELVAQVQQASTLDALVAVAATAEGGPVIAEQMHALADLGAQAVTAEAAAQGSGLDVPDLTDVKAVLTDRATVVAESMARALSEAAGREALANAGGVLTATEVASEVADHLGSLSNAFLEEQLGGALHAGLNAGRFEAMGALPGETVYVGSALMDLNVCSACAADDGREWATLEEARHTYPVAGNVDCLGRLRCRCTLVAILPTEAPASVL